MTLTVAAGLIAVAVSPPPASARSASAPTLLAQSAQGPRPAAPTHPPKPTPPPRPTPPKVAPGVGVITTPTPESDVPSTVPEPALPESTMPSALPQQLPSALPPTSAALPPAAVAPVSPGVPSTAAEVPSAIPAPSALPPAPAAGVAAPSALPAAPSALPSTLPSAVPSALPSALPSAAPSLPAAPPAAPGLAPAGQPVSAECSASWGVLGALASALRVPSAPAGANICGPGALRPAPAPVSCTKQVDAGGLQTAIDSANPGDRICATGSSTERLKVTRSGTPTAPLQIIGDGQTSVKGITVQADNVVVEGFDSAGATAPGIQLTGNGITALNNSITSPRGGDGDGIRFFGSNINILHNSVSDVRNLGGAHADCMQTYATDTPASTNVRIDSNRCTKIDNQCLIAEGPNSSAGDGSGKGESSNVTFTNNFCDTQASQAVMVDDVKNMIITNNDITGKNEKAFALDNKSTGAKISGNRVAQTIGFEVGIDNSSKHGYQGPPAGGQP
ncbi:right-handed parallel beta-helix repeat-containing protein [Pseudonocardia spinosispora]|uniref:right-handed parallel beta-helix repeat-containing protein n=1 Tax=Pseudonocardia spinosispora TaxID=103441 RepID=UPI000685DCC0|nr:right-handed parallel beta-helix repeat-containing protein [Pseudonocardia spinosispora]